MRHKFLMAAPGTGKSTCIARALEALDAKTAVRGFQSYFGPTGAGAGGRTLYMQRAGLSRVYDEENVIARFPDGGRPEALPGRFDALGRQFIDACRDEAGLFVFDECSWLEAAATGFQKSVLDSLEGDIPVIGVCRVVGDSWTAAIPAHPNVDIIALTEANRDQAAVDLAAWLSREIKTASSRPFDKR